MENIERPHIRDAFIAQYLGTLGNRFLLVVAIARFWWTGWPARARGRQDPVPLLKRQGEGSLAKVATKWVVELSIYVYLDDHLLYLFTAIV